MKIVALVLLLLCWCGSLSIGQEDAAAKTSTISGKVVSVADADTITVLTADKIQHKIRFEGIDAPEKGQDYGTKATDALKAAIGGQPPFPLPRPTPQCILRAR